MMDVFSSATIWYVYLSGRCRYGEKCPFAHSNDELEEHRKQSMERAVHGILVELHCIELTSTDSILYTYLYLYIFHIYIYTYIYICIYLGAPPISGFEIVT